MASSSEPVQPAFPTKCYVLTPTIFLQALLSVFLIIPRRLLEYFLAFVRALIQKLITLVLKRPVPYPGSSDEKVCGEAAGPGAAKAEAEVWQGMRRLGGITLTITVSVGAIKLLVVTVTVVALTLWVPFYSSARSFLSLVDRLCKTGSSGWGARGFVVDIRVGP